MKTSKSCSFHFSWLVCVSVVAWSWAQEPEEPGQPEDAGQAEDSAQPEAGALPEFKSEKYQSSFTKGQALFEKSDYRDARSAFKSAVRGAKSKADKDLVNQWIAACQLAPHIAVARKQLEAKQIHAAYQILSPMRTKVMATPAAALFKEVNTQVESQLFTVVEDFNTYNSKYSKKFGKFFEKDPKVVFAGDRCLRWTNTRNRQIGQLKFVSVPKNWTQYESVEFWINPRRLPASATMSILCKSGGGNKVKAPTTAKGSIVPMYQHRLRLAGRPGEWTLVQVPFDRMKFQGDPSLAAVEDFLIQIPAGQTWDFYIDEVRLMRKNPGQKPASRKRR